MSEISTNLLKIAIIKFMLIIFMRFQHESTVTENASSGAGGRKGRGRLEEP